MVQGLYRYGRAARAPARQFVASAALGVCVALCVALLAIWGRGLWVEFRNEIYVWHSPPFSSLELVRVERAGDALYVWPRLSKTDKQARRCAYVRMLALLELAGGGVAVRVVDTSEAAAEAYTRPGGEYLRMDPWRIGRLPVDAEAVTLRTVHRCADASWPVTVAVGPFPILPVE